MSDIVTIFNSYKFRSKFCSQSGHNHECIEETIDKMLTIMAKCAKYHNIPVEYAIAEVYNNIDVDKFHDMLTTLLNTKLCKCDGVVIQ